jgi:hypothetical protein
MAYSAGDIHRVLRELVVQVRKSNAIDDHGHPMANLVALHDAERLLGIEPELVALSQTPKGHLPRYRSFKVVEAAKINQVVSDGMRPGVTLVLDGQPEHLRVSVEYFNKHQPHPGGYYVRYEDGYESFSPAKAFEEGYTRIDASR